jgi:hypothetical protein
VRRVLALAAALASAAPAGSVGLGPLLKEGLTDGPRKAFWLTIVNPYGRTEEFSTSAIGIADESDQPRVAVLPSTVKLGAGRDARLLVIADDLQPMENYRFRVCATLAHPPTGVFINARVCSKLGARRIR